MRKQRARRERSAAPAGRVPTILALLVAATVGLGTGTPAAARQTPAPIDWVRVDQAMGRAGATQPDGAHKYAMPRSDLHVTLDGITIAPALSLGSWVAMVPAAQGVVAMGDLVFTEREVPLVIARLERGGVMVTALHNHLLGEQPRVMYLHIDGTGDPEMIARAVHDALAITGTPAPGAGGGAAAGTPARPLALDTAAIDRALGRAGTSSGGVYHVTVPRAEAIHMDGIAVPPSAGVATSLNFQPIGGGRAATNGDIVMTAGEVNDVIRALADAGIQVVAVHSHMLTEEPHLFFLHFWATGDAATLARGLRSAVDHTNVRR